MLNPSFWIGSNNIFKFQNFYSNFSNHHPNHEDEVKLRRELRKEKPDIDEEPIVPVLRPQKTEAAQEPTGEAVTRKTPLTKEDIAKMNLKKKTRKRTRKFEIDGVVVTTTTSKVIYGDEDNQKFYDEHYFR